MYPNVTPKQQKDPFYGENLKMRLTPEKLEEKPKPKPAAAAEAIDGNLTTHIESEYQLASLRKSGEENLDPDAINEERETPSPGKTSGHKSPEGYANIIILKKDTASAESARLLDLCVSKGQLQAAKADPNLAHLKQSSTL